MATKKKAKKSRSLKRPVRPLPVADLDTTYADAVRAGSRDQLHVERIRRAYQAKKAVPPVTVVTWPGGTLLLADGGYRRLARQAMNEATIKAEVVECEDEDAAREVAMRIAAGSNDHEAKPRSDDDLRVTVAAFITQPWNLDRSDYYAATTIGCHATVIKSIRLQLSAEGTIPGDSPAHADAGRYKSKESCNRGGMRLNPDGTTSRIGTVLSVDRAIESGEDRPATSRTLASASEEVVRLPPSPAAPPAESVPVIRREPPTPMPVAEKPTDEELLLRHLDDCRPHVGRLFQQLHYAASTAFGLMVLNEEAARLGLVLEEGQPQVGDRFGKVVGVGIRCDAIEGICKLIDAADARVRAALAKQTVHA